MLQGIDVDSMVGIDHNTGLVNKAATRMQHATAALRGQLAGAPDSRPRGSGQGAGRAVQLRPHVQILKGDIAAEDLSPGETLRFPAQQMVVSSSTSHP